MRVRLAGEERISAPSNPPREKVGRNRCGEEDHLVSPDGVFVLVVEESLGRWSLGDACVGGRNLVRLRKEEAV